MPLTSDGKAAVPLFLRVGAAGTFSTQAFYKSWVLACNQANVTRLNPYKLRHSFTTRMRQAGADLADVQALLGHKSPKTTASAPAKTFHIDQVPGVFARGGPAL